MGQTSDEIERYIEQKQSELGDNLTELEQRVKRAVNVRSQIEEHPMASLAVAFAGGLALSMALKRRNGDSYYQNIAEFEAEETEDPASELATAPSLAQRIGRSRNAAQAMETWDNIKNALFGIATTKVVSYLENALPGFQNEFQKSEQKRSAPSY